MVAIGVLNKDMDKIQKLTADWIKAQNDALEETEARIQDLRADRKDTV